MKLSICIPCFNRQDYIIETLESIENQVSKIKEPIEIIIIDNASTDKTIEYVKNYAIASNMNIKIYINDRNLGFDLNVKNAIEKATGEYCWLLGSDDIILNNAIELIIKNIMENEYSLIVVNSVDFINSKNICKYDYSNIKKNCKDNVFFWKIIVEKVGFISGLIFKKSKWKSVNFNMYDLGWNYIHMFAAIQIINYNDDIVYISNPLIARRINNDSFCNGNYIERLKLDIYAYEKIFSNIFIYDKNKYRQLIKYHIKSHIFNRVLGAKLNFKNRKEMKQINKLCIRNYKTYIIFWMKVFPIMLINTKTLIGMRKIYRKLNNERKYL